MDTIYISICSYRRLIPMFLDNGNIPGHHRPFRELKSIPTSESLSSKDRQSLSTSKPHHSLESRSILSSACRAHQHTSDRRDVLLPAGPSSSCKAVRLHILLLL